MRPAVPALARFHRDRSQQHFDQRGSHAPRTIFRLVLCRWVSSQSTRCVAADKATAIKADHSGKPGGAHPPGRASATFHSVCLLAPGHQPHQCVHTRRLERPRHLRGQRSPRLLRATGRRHPTRHRASHRLHRRLLLAPGHLPQLRLRRPASGLRRRKSGQQHQRRRTYRRPRPRQCQPPDRPASRRNSPPARLLPPHPAQLGRQLDR